MPVNDVIAPARAYAIKLAGIVCLVFGLLAILGLTSITRILNPLRKVAAGAAALSTVNFSSDKAGEELKLVASKLPRKSNDEVGKVSSAFVHLTEALDASIKELKESMARQHSMQGELNAARDIQESLLTVGLAGVTGSHFAASALMEAAKEVGGDLYDVLETPDGKRAVLLGDVSGKGVSAALLMSMTLTLLRLGVGRGFTPAETLKLVNDQLAKNNPSCMFVTIWLGVFDPETGKLVYANGGHCAPAIVPASGVKPVRWLREISGPLVGVMDDATFIDRQATIETGDVVLVYSDGVTEAMNEARQLYSEEGLLAALNTLHDATPQAVVQGVMKAVALHRGKAAQSDDITMVAFKMTGDNV